MEQQKTVTNFGKKETGIITAWWESLSATPGDRARLRRCRSPAQVCFEPVFHRLITALGPVGMKYPDRIAVIVGVLSHVRTNIPSMKFASLMGTAKEKMKKARVSGLRFRRLIQYSEREDLYLPLIRMVAMVDDSANVADLAESIYWWNERTKKDWAFAYYSSAPNDEI